VNLNIQIPKPFGLEPKLLVFYVQKYLTNVRSVSETKEELEVPQLKRNLVPRAEELLSSL
jgi:hypothetical protein